MNETKPITLGEYSLYSILAFVFGFIFWPIGAVFGIIALSEINKNPSLKSSTPLAWLGIVLTPILVVVGMFIFFGLAVQITNGPFVENVLRLKQEASLDANFIK